MRKFTPILVFLLLAVSTACGSSTAKNDASKSEKQASNTAEKQVNANIPKELRGIWDVQGQPCKPPGNPDSDTRIDISPTSINGYEHWYSPRSVEQLSNSPKTWRIQSKMHSDGEESDQTQIFAISGVDTLTVIDNSSPEIYERCK
ncbi:hypothetical protein IEQ11_11900 [Lysobacter capsici]|uniref:hypothetical protein n=1 Tax=Lysobacter capsici TaxID=435897 RepID=UPI00177EF0E3|nr:hypothetical protein [Lysobacter capsici]UOF17280.1 hypothetical protein IEQ11_11900 [Lysobacter capsici]